MTPLTDLMARTWPRPWGQTQWILVWIIALCAVGLVMLLQFGFVSRQALPGFLAWAFLSSLASFLAGSLLGLLFGLPPVPAARRAEALSSSAAGSPPAEGDVGAVVPSRYGESTSLEQVADWLTKIIVGLTLTQFGTWSERFRGMSGELTTGLLCPGAARGCGTVPGGALMSAFALAGFLFAYLWMRRFFIKEMVTRDHELTDILQRQQRAKAENRVQKAESGESWLSAKLSGALAVRGMVDAPQADGQPQIASGIAAIVADGVAKAVDGARPAALAIVPGADPDDPWRGAFGGSPSNERCVLSAVVAAVPNQLRNFQIDINVTGLSPDAQKTLAARTVLFYLHPTFGREVKVCTFGVDGRASLTLFGYGAFTVGALLEDGSRLELNLAELPGIPDAFRTG
jgi:hypothetical protein